MTGFRVIGEGGSIPFMGMLHQKFPDAQFVITGVLGPNRQATHCTCALFFVCLSFPLSNAHGPNEFLHVQMSANVTKVVVHVLAELVHH